MSKQDYILVFGVVFFLFGNLFWWLLEGFREVNFKIFDRLILFFS